MTPTTAQASGPVETTLRAPPPPVPVSAGGVVRRERQRFELTLPKGWKVDQSTTRSYAQFGQPWLVISPGGRVVSANDSRRMTIFTAVHEPREYPGRVAPDARPLSFTSFDAAGQQIAKDTSFAGYEDCTP